MSAAEKPIAITMGEPAGIGGELTLKAWLERRSLDMPAFFAIDDPERLARLAKRLGWTVPVTAVDTPDAAPGIFADALPVLANAVPGSTPSPASSRKAPARPSAATSVG